VANNITIRYGFTSSGVHHAHFRIPKTKTSDTGTDIHLTAAADISSPIAFIRNHLRVHAGVPPGALFFAFTSHGDWFALTKALLLARCNIVWGAAGLSCLAGHAFRIGGAMELLLRGTPPDVVMVQGRWKSHSSLEYWRRIDEILPLFYFWLIY